MSALAPTLPVADSLPRTRSGGTLDSSHDPASDRRRVINNEGTPAPDPQTGDRRKIIHRQPVAGGDPPSPHDPPSRRRDQDESHGSVSSEAGGTGGSEDGPAPDHDAAPPDRRKVVHRSASASSSPAGDDNRLVGTEPVLRATLAASLGGIRASAHEDRVAAEMAEDSEDTDGSGGRGVGTRLVETTHRMAATLMLLAMLGSVVGGALPARTDGHDASAETSAHLDVQEANVATGLFSLWALAVSGWNALAGDDICGDCNLPADDGCKCVCYSGGYDPDDPACQF